MEHLKEAIGLQGYAQKDPLVEYKNEAFRDFEQLKRDIQVEIASRMFRVQIQVTPPPPVPAAQPLPAGVPAGVGGGLGLPGAVAPGLPRPAGGGTAPELAATPSQIAGAGLLGAMAPVAPPPLTPMPAGNGAPAGDGPPAGNGVPASSPPPAAGVRPPVQSYAGLSARAVGPGRANSTTAPSTSPTGAKVGRNDPCPCGSGKKYKRCHGR
jgi:preprotein translocase subunit SecA